MRPFPLLATSAALLVLNAGASHAITLIVEGQNYDVTTFSGSYDIDKLKFATPASGGVMPWWGNQTLAQKFAEAAFAKNVNFGFPNQTGARGPFFSFRLNLITVSQTAFTYDPTHVLTQNLSQVASYPAFAQATLTPSASVPGPVPLVGAFAAFRLSRQLRRRVRQSV